MFAGCDPFGPGPQEVIGVMSGALPIAKASPRRRVAAAAALAALLLAACPARADSAFMKDIKTQNAHHFAKPLTLPKEHKPPTIERDWEDKFTRKSWKMSEGPITIEVTLKKGGPPDGLLFQNPILSLSVEGKQVLSVQGSESFPDNPIFLVQIAEMDPGNPYKEVVFSSFTGGAHCCSDTRILVSSKDGGTWREIEIGPFDGGPLEARDVDGDGRYEFVMRDNAFLYAFGCYACATAPYHVLQLEDGKIVDASSKPAFRARHVNSLKNMVEGAGGDRGANSFLAGYVAQKIRLEEGAQAWKFMLKYYDRKDDWGLEACSVKENDRGECPGKKVMLSFPQALERFLVQAGYELKK